MHCTIHVARGQGCSVGLQCKMIAGGWRAQVCASSTNVFICFFFCNEGICLMIEVIYFIYRLSAYRCHSFV